MKKEEIYEALVGMFKKTGQGVPKIFIRGEHENTVEELIKEGKIREVYLSSVNMTHLVLNNPDLYIVEDENDNRHAITFIRYFMDPNDEELFGGLGNILKRDMPEKTIREFFEENLLGKYNEWLEKNRVQLEATKKFMSE